MAPWHLGRMFALDFESSDKIPATARIVTCALIGVGGGLPTEKRTWLLNPGVPMNPEAIAVHGITDEYAAELGAVEAEEAAFQRQLMKVLDLAEGYCFAAHERMPERPVPPTLAAGEPPHLNPEVGADD
jgi:hypothetical protein